MNLAVNARDAMPDGGKLTIETANVDARRRVRAQASRTSAPGRYVMLAVSDTGVGMDADDARAHLRAVLHDQGARARAPASASPPCYGIVKQSGRTHLASTASRAAERHSRFIFPWRLALLLPAKNRATLPCDAVSQGHETILLVEDEAGVRELITEVLSSVGYHVLAAIDGEDALKVSAGHSDQIHLMITDVIMPSMSGRELADRLRIERPDMACFSSPATPATRSDATACWTRTSRFWRNPSRPPHSPRKSASCWILKKNVQSTAAIAYVSMPLTSNLAEALPVSRMLSCGLVTSESTSESCARRSPAAAPWRRRPLCHNSGGESSASFPCPREPRAVPSELQR